MSRLVGIPDVAAASSAPLTATLIWTHEYRRGDRFAAGRVDLTYDRTAGEWREGGAVFDLLAARFGQSDPAPPNIRVLFTLAGTQGTSLTFAPIESAAGTVDLTKPLNVAQWVVGAEYASLQTQQQNAIANLNEFSTQGAAVAQSIADALPLLDGLLADIEQLQAALEADAGLTPVENEAALTGKPAGGYRLLDSQRRVWWDGAAITAEGEIGASAAVVEARRLTPTAASMYARALGEQGTLPPTALARTLAALADGGTARWVVVHNSIGEGADQRDRLDTYVAQARQMADRLFGPGKLIIYNRSLGGRRVRDLANPNFKSVAGYVEPGDIFSGYAQRVDTLDGTIWPTAAGTSWLDEVLGIGAEGIFLANTMNITAAADPATDLEPDFRAVLAAMQAHASKPDIILGTDIMPAADFGRDAATMRQTPELVRLLGREFGYPVVDANRLSNILMYGIDPTVLETTLVRENWGGGVMDAWRGDKSAWSHSVPFRQLTRAQDQGYVVSYDLLQDGAVEFIVRFSAASPELLNVMVRYDEAQQSYVQLQLFPQQATLLERRAGQGPQALGSETFPVPFDEVDQAYRIEFDGADVRVYRNGARVIRAASPVNLRPGLIQFGTADSGFKLPAAIINMRVIGRTPVQAADLLTPLELLGDSTDATGGNGYNHPSAQQYQLTYAAAFGRLFASLLMARRVPVVVPAQLLTLLNGWTDWADRERVSVSRVGRRVTLRGAAIDGTAAVLGVLPAAFRPVRTVRRATDTSAGPSAVDITPDGNISSGAFGAGTWVTFEAHWEV